MDLEQLRFLHGQAELILEEVKGVVDKLSQGASLVIFERGEEPTVHARLSNIKGAAEMMDVYFIEELESLGEKQTPDTPE